MTFAIDDLVRIEKGREVFRVVGFELADRSAVQLEGADGDRFTVYAWRLSIIDRAASPNAVTQSEPSQPVRGEDT